VSAPVLTALDVAGDREAWAEAGFAVDADGTVRAGHVALRTGVGERGIDAWTLGAAPLVEPATHPNGTTLLDHLVVFTGDPERTTETFGEIGLEPRRVRDTGTGTTQTFFRAGEVIIELVGAIPNVDGERFWGLAFSVADLDACARLLGDRLGAVKDAVQPGRRIATLRHEACGLTVPIAFMSE
jgi:hypothetical protein